MSFYWLLFVTISGAILIAIGFELIMIASSPKLMDPKKDRLASNLFLAGTGLIIAGSFMLFAPLSYSADAVQ